jgi:hypothetical protein
MPFPVKIYFASKRHHAELLKNTLRDPRYAGLHAISRWMETSNLSENDTKPAAYWQQENYIDIRNADVVVMFGEPGDALEGASQEVGYAIAHGKPIRIVIGPDVPPKPWMMQGGIVQRRGSLTTALDEIVGWTKQEHPLIDSRA